MQRVDVLERNFCWGCSVDCMEVKHIGSRGDSPHSPFTNISPK